MRRTLFRFLLAGAVLFCSVYPSLGAEYPFVRSEDRVFSQNSYTVAQSSTTQITPSAGHGVRLQGFIVSSGGANDVDIVVGGTTRFRIYATDKRIETVHCGGYPIFHGGINDVVAVTSTTGVSLAVTIWGYEEQL